MRIGVCVKQVPAWSARMDSATGVLVRSSSQGVMNPYDLFALEAALRAAGTLRSAEAVSGTEVFAITMGPPQAEQTLREALALGGGIRSREDIGLFERMSETMGRL